MQVEVCVQDCFFNTLPLETNPLSTDESEEQQTAQVAVSVESSCPIAPETWEVWFHRWLETLAPTLSPHQSYDLTVRLTDDDEIQALNSQYRQKDQPTDVLAFAALELDCPQPQDIEEELPLYLGDIVISIATAERQATEQGHTLQIELAWLASHGLLHLLGWDHPDDETLARMLDQQRILLQTVGLATEPAESLTRQ